MKIKAIITGVTGMVGEGVLHECLLHPDVESVLVVNRKPCGVKHEKLKEIIHKDFFNFSSIEDQLTGYNACYFCAGVSSVGKKEEEYKHITYDLTLSFTNTLLKLNSEITICYVSGSGTDSTEKGRIMWARVKGKTENTLLKMFPGSAYMFRPGYMKPTKGQKNILKFYFGWQLFYPIMKFLMPKFTCTLAEAGKAMINCAARGYSKNILEVKDIIDCSK